jgi:1-acyl-sn-glycerol-3-phosphate acyltransferase
MAPPEMPPVSNRPLYVYRVLIKWLSFFIFGVGTLILVFLCFPVLRLFLRRREPFRKYARRLVSFLMRFFTRFMEIMGILKLEVDDRTAFRRLSSKIIVANHPSLLDVVMLLSLLPNADCIIRGNLSRTIVRGIVRQLYIPNSLNFNDLEAACVDSLNQGNNIIFFPEGTRTPRSGKMILKKGAFRVALLSGRGIIPVFIGGTDKYGLGKRDPWTAFNHQEKYIYRITMGEEISPRAYADTEEPGAVRRLAGDVRTFFLHPPETQGAIHEQTL